MFFYYEPETVIDLDVVERLGEACVHRMNGAYRLSVPRYEGCTGSDLMESEDLDFLLDAMRIHASNKEFMRVWWDSEIEPVERILGGGRSIRASKTKGEMLRLTAHAGDPSQQVGLVTASFTNWQGEVVLGTPTFSASSKIDEAHRGKGFARAMYDLIEEIVGLPMVPHGRRMVVGTLSPLAADFWRKRATARSVPGFEDPSVDEREAAWDEAVRLVEVSKEDRNCPLIATALAEKSSRRVALLIGSRDIGFPDMYGWCLDSEGRVEEGSAGKNTSPCPASGTVIHDAREAIDLLHDIYESVELGYRFDHVMDLKRAKADELIAYEALVGSRLAGPAASRGM